MGQLKSVIGRTVYPRGAWVSGTDYKQFNIVMNKGSVFMATQDSPSAEPTVSYDAATGVYTVSAGWALWAFGYTDAFAQEVQAQTQFLNRSFGKYAAIGQKTLSVGTSGKYINVNGKEVSNSNYAISEPISLNKGDDLLIPSASPVAAEVSIVSRKVTNTYDEPILYNIAYAADGKMLTATADYDTTFIYTAVYDTSGETETFKYWTREGQTFATLPQTHEVTKSFYVPLVNQSVSAMPDTGYYVFPADEAMEVVISAFNATVNGGVCLVHGVGLIKNYATNMVGATKQHVLAEVIAAMAARIDALESTLAGEIGHLSVRDLQVGRTLRGINLDGGFALQAAGTPAADLVPSNWDFDTYGDWTGAPQFIGQLYIDTANKIVYIAVGVESISDWVRISNA